MFPKLLVLFIGIPLIELALLVKLGELVGFWPTIALVITTGVIGASLAQTQGFKVFGKIQTELAAGRIPTHHLVDGLLIFAGGIVLLTPGLLTDILGFSLMIPWVRTQFKRWLTYKFSNMVQTGQTQIFYQRIDQRGDDDGIN